MGHMPSILYSRPPVANHIGTIPIDMPAPPPPVPIKREDDPFTREHSNELTEGTVLSANPGSPEHIHQLHSNMFFATIPVYSTPWCTCKRMRSIFYTTQAHSKTTH